MSCFPKSVRVFTASRACAAENRFFRTCHRPKCCFLHGAQVFGFAIPRRDPEDRLLVRDPDALCAKVPEFLHFFDGPHGLGLTGQGEQIIH